MSKKLSDELLLSALLSCKTQTEAAEQLGISKQTISRRMKDNDFREKLFAYRKQKLECINTKLVQASEQAVDVLIGLLKSDSEISRYNSASRILSLSGDFTDRTDIIRRIDELETTEADKDNE
jgi:hypothetical protein